MAPFNASDFASMPQEMFSPPMPITNTGSLCGSSLIPLGMSGHHALCSPYNHSIVQPHQNPSIRSPGEYIAKADFGQVNDTMAMFNPVLGFTSNMMLLERVSNDTMAMCNTAQAYGPMAPGMVTGTMATCNAMMVSNNMAMSNTGQAYGSMPQGMVSNNTMVMCNTARAYVSMPPEMVSNNMAMSNTGQTYGSMPQGMVSNNTMVMCHTARAYVSMPPEMEPQPGFSAIQSGGRQAQPGYYLCTKPCTRMCF